MIGLAIVSSKLCGDLEWTGRGFQQGAPGGALE